MQKFTARRIRFTDSDLQVFTTTLKSLLLSNSKEDAIWTNAVEQEKTLGVTNI